MRRSGTGIAAWNFTREAVMIRKIVKGLVLGVIALLPIIFFACGRRAQGPLVYTGYLQGPPGIEIALVAKSEEVQVGAGADFELRAARSGVLVDSGRVLEDARVTVRDGELWVGERGTGARELELTTGTDGSLRVNGKRYRGGLKVLVDGKDRVTVVERVDIESYLAGVLGKEVYLSWPMSALEAQTIAARTYALYWMKRRKPGAAYDLVAGHRFSQEYGGVEAERRVAWEVVDETRGVVLTSQWQLFPSYYHSVCGGHTRSAAAVFGVAEVRPLSGVPCDFCFGVKGYRWEARVGAEEITEKLVASGMKLGELRAIEVEEGNEFRVLVVGSDGRKRMRAQDFRLVVGSKRVKSPEFRVRREGGSFVFEGKGFGHGAGMCQWGAETMASKGYSAAEILRYYYPGAELVKVY